MLTDVNVETIDVVAWGDAVTVTGDVTVTEAVKTTGVVTVDTEVMVSCDDIVTEWVAVVVDNFC